MTLGAETRRALVEGARLFDGGRFFEAHEVWESAWLGERGTARELLQGLIQIAAGYHQAFDRRHPRGCARLLAEGMARLEALGAEAETLGLDSFRRAVASDCARARAWERGESEPLARVGVPHLGLLEE